MASRFVSFSLRRIRNLMISIQKNSNLMSLAHSSSSSSSNQANSFLEDLKELETLLPKIRAEMKAAEESELRGGFDKLWMAELKDVAYDAEDVLDEYQYEVLRLQLDAGVAPPETAQERESGEDEVPVLPFASSFMTEVSISDGLRKRIKEKIKKIKAKYDEISRDRDRLQLPVEIFEDKEEHGSFLKKRRVDGTTKYRQTTSLVVKSDVYGRDSEKIELIEWLFSSSTSKFSVVAIVGQGGLGKTTLAQLVYNDDRVSKNFDLQIWICVSDNFRVARLTKEMLEFNSMESCVLSDLSQLQHNLKIKLKGKKLLLVLDDVWNENPTLWESFIEPLRVACVVRVIVTTRNIRVAKIMQTEEPHHLRPLSESDCWQLFQYHAFFGRDPYQFSYLVDIGKMIVKKCGGLPLAVKSIGGLLRHENTSEESWTDVLQSELWDLDEKEQILPALKLSYSRMPGYLRPCFQCCSMFPKDHPLFKKKLVRLWMAQGYIETVDERTMEELGCEYFDELHHRSFVGHYEYGDFKMHDSIHDLALHISGIENQSVVDLEKCDDLNRVRHLFVKADEELMTFLLSKKLRPDLRTLFFHFDSSLRSSSLQFALSMTTLRALHMADIKQDELPASIGNLKHLRYLYIYSNYLIRLHGSLGQLLNLQVLIIRCLQLKELPWEIGSLANLQLLKIKCEAVENLPESLLQLCNLHTLVLRCWKLGKMPGPISQLYNLQKLDFKLCRNLRELPSDAGNLQKLKYLDLLYSGVTSLPPEIWKLKKIDSFFTNIIDVRKAMPCGIGQLNELVNLTGLAISGLENLSIEEAKEVNLKGMRGLNHLYLEWHNAVRYYNHRRFVCTFKFDNNIYDTDFDHRKKCLNVNLKSTKVLVDEEMMAKALQSLRPDLNLKVLHLCGFNGVRYPSWMDDPSFNQLTEVSLYECGNVEISCLPMFGQLPSLQRLYLLRISHAKSIGGEFCCCNPNVKKSSESNTVAFPSLKYLELKDMPDLEEWYGFQSDLPQLKELRITNCPILRTIPILPTKLEILSIVECLKLSSLLGLHDLFRLCDLWLVGCPDLEFPKNIPLQAKFRKFECRECPKLNLLLGPQNVSSLETLFLIDCVGFHLPADNFLSTTLFSLWIQAYLNPLVLPQLNTFYCLDELRICGCPGTQLPLNFVLPPNLKYLDINDIPNKFRLLGLCNHSSLSELNISGCHELQLSQEEFLPSTLVHFCTINCIKVKSTLRFKNCDHLYSLKIKGCPELQLLPNDSLPVSIVDLHIKDCLRITSLLGLQYLDCLRDLHLSCCPELQLSLDEALPNELRTVRIVNCPKLTLLVGLQDLTFLNELHLAKCPQLQLMRDTPLSSMPDHLEIVGCPGLREWCNRNGYEYKEVIPLPPHADYNSWMMKKIF